MASIISAGTTSGTSLNLSGDTSGVLQLASNGSTTAVTINTSQGVSVLNCLGVGNATPSTSGAGITFPATQSASTDGNTLDDYEEGTWTPALRGGGSAGSYSATSSGRYLKIGKQVWVWGDVTISNKGSWTGSVLFSLPFSVDTAFGTGAVRSQLHTFSGALICEWSTADSVTARFNSTVSGGSQANLDWSGVSQASGNYLSFSLVYQATA